MARKTTKGDGAELELAQPKTRSERAKPKAAKPKPVKSKQALPETAKAKPAKLVARSAQVAPAKAKASSKKAIGRPRKQAAEPETLSALIASLYETATEIVADRLQPSVDQIKALARAVIGQAEKKARKAAKTTRGKSAKDSATPSKAARQKSKK